MSVIEIEDAVDELPQALRGLGRQPSKESIVLFHTMRHNTGKYVPVRIDADSRDAFKAHWNNLRNKMNSMAKTRRLGLKASVRTSWESRKVYIAFVEDEQ